MIYATLFYEFFLIGLLAVGGGAATIPFLFDLSQKYGWFSALELTDMIAVSEATPGPICVNMATFAGLKTAGIIGGCVATFGLVLPSVVIVILICKITQNKACYQVFSKLLANIRPVVLALILNAAFQISLISCQNLINFFVLVFTLILMKFYKAGPIFYIIGTGILGYTLKL